MPFKKCIRFAALSIIRIHSAQITTSHSHDDELCCSLKGKSWPVDQLDHNLKKDEVEIRISARNQTCQIFWAVQIPKDLDAEDESRPSWLRSRLRAKLRARSWSFDNVHVAHDAFCRPKIGFASFESESLCFFGNAPSTSHWRLWPVKCKVVPWDHI